MKAWKISVFMIVLLLLIGSLPVSAEDTAPTTQTVVDIPVQKNGEIPSPADKVLTDRSRIESTERLRPADVEAISLACAELLEKSINKKVELTQDMMQSYTALQSCDGAYCSPTYIYAVRRQENGLMTEYIYYLDGSMMKVVSYDYNGSRYTAINDDDRLIIKEGTMSAVVSGASPVAINVYDVLFGMAIAVVGMLIVLVIVRSFKKKNA